MVNKFAKFPLWECSRTLVDVAMGRVPAETVLTNAKLINVCTHEIQENISVAITCGRIAIVGDCSHCIGKGTKVIDCKGNYIAPSFMDGHIHIESSMMTAGEFAKSTIPHGTSGVFMDPHEICNVLGLKGVRYMLDDAKRTPLKAMLTTPSCVPAVPGFEDTGSSIGPEDIKETMTWDECVGLGEMMNFPGILSSDKRTHDIVGETIKAGKCVTGHYTMPEVGAGLNGYIAAGNRCCHESTREIDALSKMRLGMYALLREGSAWLNLKEVAKAITKHDVDSRFACLVCDDIHPETIKNKGHLDYVIKRAIEEGIDPITAIQMVTINVAQCFQLDHEMGSVTPSKCADLVVISDLNNCKIEKVFINGDLVADNGKMTIEFAPFTYPKDATSTVNLSPITEKDLEIKATGKKADVHVIEILAGETITNDVIKTLNIEDGTIKADGEKDILKAVVFERHHKTGNKGFGFIKGFGIKCGALAQTVAHDAHNLFVIGSNDKDMVLAVNTLIECGGGAVAVKDGKIIGLLPLPVAGLMSERPLDEMASLVEKIQKAWKDLGCAHPSPFMTMAIIPLACVPNIRLTDRGLVDCINFKFVDLIKKTY